MPHALPQALTAAALFAGTTVDDLVVLALLFGPAPDLRRVRRVVAGQYLGFGVVVMVSAAGALGAAVWLPPVVVRLLGLIPLVWGLKLGWVAWRDHRAGLDRPGSEPPDHPELARSNRPGPAPPTATATSTLAVAGLVVANCGDDLGVYLPAFSAAGPSALLVYVPVFLALTGVWCALARRVAAHPVVATSIGRRGHVLLPVVLCAVGLVVLFG